MKKHWFILFLMITIWLFITYSIIFVKIPVKQSPVILKDSISQPKDTLINCQGKKVLFIGDSHTTYDKGWQDQLCKKTGMVGTNTAIGGKRTDWMLTQLLKNIDSSYNYCFIWGGANDAASCTPLQEITDNIQKMVNVCNGYGVTPIILTGFDPELCINVSKQDLSGWGNYISKYTELQHMISIQVKKCTVVKNHFISRKDGDCDDFICHMSASGHRKMANGIINNLKFKTF
jgi:hypothetical protein